MVADLDTAVSKTNACAVLHGIVRMEQTAEGSAGIEEGLADLFSQVYEPMDVPTLQGGSLRLLACPAATSA